MEIIISHLIPPPFVLPHTRSHLDLTIRRQTANLGSINLTIRSLIVEIRSRSLVNRTIRSRIVAMEPPGDRMRVLITPEVVKFSLMFPQMTL